MPCTRLILFNTTTAPDRDELCGSERTYGDLIFSGLGLEFGGYEIVPGTGKMAARWMVPEERWNETLDFVETTEFEGYELMLYAQVDSPLGTHSRRFA